MRKPLYKLLAAIVGLVILLFVVVVPLLNASLGFANLCGIIIGVIVVGEIGWLSYKLIDNVFERMN